MLQVLENLQAVHDFIKLQFYNKIFFCYKFVRPPYGPILKKFVRAWNRGLRLARLENEGTPGPLQLQLKLLLCDRSTPHFPVSYP